MRDISTIVKDYYDTAAVPVTAAEAIAHSAMDNDRRSVPNWAFAVAAATIVIMLFGGLSILLGGSDGSIESSPGAESATASPAPMTVLGVSEVAESWIPAFTDPVAKIPSLAATCPSGTTADVRGPNPEHRPMIGDGNPSNQGAVFDTRLGRIVLLDRFGETWMFDVCANSWIEMHADVDEWYLPTERLLDDHDGLAVYSGDLVYDADSDRTIAFGNLGYYDSDSNAWYSLSSKGYVAGRLWKRGAAYDPMSGLVVVAHQTERYGRDADEVPLSLSSYDVDTDTWSLIGETDVHPWSFLIGYSATIDRLIFATFDNDPSADHQSTSLVDPRTGRTTLLSAPSPDIFSAWGAWYPYAYGVDGAVLVVDEVGHDPVHFGEGDVCVFDLETRSWGDCPIDSIDGPKWGVESAAGVYDPINERLVFVLTNGNVWAVDLDTGDWTELL